MHIIDFKNKLLNKDDNNEYPYFNKWKENVLEHIGEYPELFNRLKNINNVDAFINTLISLNLVDTELINDIKEMLKTGIDLEGNQLHENDKKDWFKPGKTTDTEHGTYVVVDSDPDINSVTWDLKKKFNDNDIHNEITKFINTINKMRGSYDNKKRIDSLLQKLKFIRNTFKRTSEM